MKKLVALTVLLFVMVINVGAQNITGADSSGNLTLPGKLTIKGDLTTNVTGGGTQCAQVSNTGVISGTSSLCNAAANWSTILAGSNAQTGAFSTAAPWTFSAAGAASIPSVSITGNPWSFGTGTTNFPLVYLSGGGTVTTWSTNGTEFGINAFAGFSGNFVDFKLNGDNQRFSVDSTGLVTAITVNATSAYQANGTPGVTQTAIAVGTLATKEGIVTTFTGVSDERLKTFTPYVGGLDVISRITPIRYRWNELGQKWTGLSGDQEFVGFSANNVQKSIPEAILGTEGPDKYLSFDDRPVIAALVNAVKEQQAEIISLKADILKLKLGALTASDAK